jgi:tryptophan halogenase
VTQLIELFPTGRVEEADVAEFNRRTDFEYDRIRDFLILHYHATTRDDSSFWNHVRTMAVPDSLREKMELWRRAGLVFEPSWIAVYVGQGIVPEYWDQRADALDPGALAAAMERLHGGIEQAVRGMPDHDEFLRRSGAAAPRAD